MKRAHYIAGGKEDLYRENTVGMRLRSDVQQVVRT